MNLYEKFFKSLNKEKIKYLVVGGVAVNLHGYMRFTGDIDIIISLDEKNIEKLDSLMKKMDYWPRIPVQLKELIDQKKIEKWMKEKSLKAYTYTPQKDSILQLDIVIEESLKFDKIYKKKVTKKINSTTIPTICLDDLIGMKKKAGRDRDMEDLSALLDMKLQ